MESHYSENEMKCIPCQLLNSHTVYWLSNWLHVYGRIWRMSFNFSNGRVFRCGFVCVVIVQFIKNKIKIDDFHTHQTWKLYTLQSWLDGPAFITVHNSHSNNEGKTEALQIFCCYRLQIIKSRTRVFPILMSKPWILLFIFCWFIITLFLSIFRSAFIVNVKA